MAIPGKACALCILIIFCFALACCEARANGVVRGLKDPFRGTNLARHDIAGRSEKIFNVLQFGAKPDGRKDCTQAFIRAWRATCDFRGNSRLLIPGGTFYLAEVVFEGPCNGPSPKVVQIIGTLLASTEPSDFSSSAWILFESIVGLIVTGRGTIDGQGPAVWKYSDCNNNNNCSPLASNIKFNKVTNGVIRSITSLNSKGVHLFITNCETIRARNLHIIAPQDSPNTDGIHVSHSNNVRIAKTIIATGDDCISIINGATNVAVNRVTCGPGHGISVGSLGKYPNEEDVRGITVKNCTLIGTENGIRIKSWPGSPPSAASGMVFQNINMKNVKNPIIIDQGYCPNSHCNKAPSRVRLSDIHYINIKGTSSSPAAVKLMCSSQFPCQNVQFYNIDLRSQQRGLPATSTCENAKVSYGGRVYPLPCK